MPSDVMYIPEMSNDTRLRVFRRNLTIEGAFDGMEVDAYVVLSERYVIVGDTMLCPEDMAAGFESIGDVVAGREILGINIHADWGPPLGNHYFTGGIAYTH